MNNERKEREKMKRLTAYILATLIPIVTLAAPPIVYDIEADWQQTQSLDAQSFQQGAGVVLRYRLKSRGQYLDLTGLTARWEARSSITSTQALQEAGTTVTATTPDYFEIDLDSDETGTARTNWVYSLIVEDSGVDYPLGTGTVNILESSWTGASSILVTTSAAAYADAAVATHAAVVATSNSLGHVKIGSGINVDTNGTISTAASSLNLQQVTDNGATTTNSITVPSVNFGSGVVLSYDSEERAQSLSFAHPDGGAVTINGELYRMWKNIDTVAITNGQPVCLFAGSGRVGTIKLADADDTTRNKLVGVYTGSTPLAVDAIGRITTRGAVESFNIRALMGEGTVTEGSRIYLHTTAGTYTTNAPSAPVDAIQVGVVTYLSPSPGNSDLEVAILGCKEWSELDARYTSSDYNLADGLTIDRQSCFITNISGTVYFETEKIGGGDIRAVFGGTTYTLDCTTGSGVGGRARVALTSGTDSVPVGNYIYLTQNGSECLLNASTSFPSGEFAALGRAVLQSAATTLTDGPLALQRFSDDITRSGGRGRVDYMGERIRAQGAVWASGAQATVNDDAGGNVTLEISSGVVYQMHRQTFAAEADPATMHVVNDPDGAFTKITNFNEINKDANGDAIVNRRWFGVRIIGFAASGDSGVDRLFVQLPTGVYSTEAAAIADSSGYDVNTIDNPYKGGAFNIARVVIYKNNAGVYSLVETQDKRGELINALGTGGGSSMTQVFPDSTFRVYDADDATKELAFDAGGITTGTTRTLTIPDANGTIALTEDISATYLPLAGGTMTGDIDLNGNTITNSNNSAALKIKTGSIFGIEMESNIGGVTISSDSGGVIIDAPELRIDQGFTLNGSTIVTNLQQTLSSSSNAIPTSGAVIDYGNANWSGGGAGGYRALATPYDFVFPTAVSKVLTNGFTVIEWDQSNDEASYDLSFKLAPTETNMTLYSTFNVSGSGGVVYGVNSEKWTNTVAAANTPQEFTNTFTVTRDSWGRVDIAVKFYGADAAQTATDVITQDLLLEVSK